jgi:hypothetical protein
MEQAVNLPTGPALPHQCGKSGPSCSECVQLLSWCLTANSVMIGKQIVNYHYLELGIKVGILFSSRWLPRNRYKVDAVSVSGTIR